MLYVVNGSDLSKPEAVYPEAGLCLTSTFLANA